MNLRSRNQIQTHEPAKVRSSSLLWLVSSRFLGLLLVLQKGDAGDRHVGQRHRLVPLNELVNFPAGTPAARGTWLGSSRSYVPGVNISLGTFELDRSVGELSIVIF